jgi:hypothetical protein
VLQRLGGEWRDLHPGTFYPSFRDTGAARQAFCGGARIEEAVPGSRLPARAFTISVDAVVDQTSGKTKVARQLEVPSSFADTQATIPSYECCGNHCLSDFQTRNILLEPQWVKPHENYAAPVTLSPTWAKAPQM